MLYPLSYEGLEGQHTGAPRPAATPHRDHSLGHFSIAY